MTENKEAPRVMTENKEAPPVMTENKEAQPVEEDEIALESDTETWPVAKLGNGGVILVLFETPSGFALFGYDGVKLYVPNAIQNIWGEFVMDFMQPVWLRDFKTFKDKAGALNLDTGVSKELAFMITQCIRPGQKLAVGKPEYKTIIESQLGISCLHDNEVMELMWGLNNQMIYLLPDEYSKVANKDCLPMCEGMRYVLNRYRFDVKPEIVNRSIIEATGLVYECDFNVKKHAEFLHRAGQHLKAISGIEFEDWDLLKLATALVMVCYPKGEQIVAGNLKELFGDDYSTLVEDTPKYKNKLRHVACFRVYEEMLWARKVRYKALRELAAEIRMAQEAYETKQAMSHE